MTEPTEQRVVTWSMFGRVDAPMGLQFYESELFDAIDGLGRSSWSVETRRTGGMRDRSDVDVRVPLRLLEKAPPAVARALGAVAHRGARHVHRFDLRLPPSKGPEVVTVHDLPPLRFPDEGALPGWSVSTARRARLVICPSEFAADEVRSLLGVTDVVTIPNGAAQVFTDPVPLTTGELRALGIRSPFVLHAGGASQRKNLRSLAGAWRDVASLLPEHTLVLVGPPDPRRDAAFADVPNVVKVGYLAPAVVARLMATTEAVVVPSVYEGFGLPALEGMTAGAPVVAADRGALPEVCGDAGLLVEPTSAGLAEGILSVCGDARLREQLTTRGRARSRAFSWSGSAAAHLEAYDLAFG